MLQTDIKNNLIGYVLQVDRNEKKKRGGSF
jgi:hypothetical protein